ncbi:hypothetical protein HPB51_001008 [Rhipicephalus microplus]|uniref:Uncharacterized protein n=1 Tax=Rhipicephalus microplus TaxID=6941 RepID=A0A9J6DE31_RHIMP|nr:hypothetical protein HPB51_001008 [Rhipicephalus microplus]
MYAVRSSDIKLRVNENQNVLTINTSSEHIVTALEQIAKILVHAATYDISSDGIVPDNLCKGVVNGIGYEITPDNFLTEVEVPGYEVLTCRRLGDSGAMVLTFCASASLPSSTRTDRLFTATSTNGLFPTVESATKQDTTRMCALGLLTHQNVECAGINYHLTTTSAALLACFTVATTRRLPNPCPNGFCHQSTDSNHPGQLIPTRKAQSPSPSPGRQSSASGSALANEPFQGYVGPKRGNSPLRSGFAGQQGSPGWRTDGTTHDHDQQSGSPKKAQTAGWAEQFPLFPPSPHQSHHLTKTSMQQRTPQPMSVDTQLQPDMPPTTARSEYCTLEELNEMAISLRKEFAAVMQVEMHTIKNNYMAELTAPLQQLIQQVLQPAVQQI